MLLALALILNPGSEETASLEQLLEFAIDHLDSAFSACALARRACRGFANGAKQRKDLVRVFAKRFAAQVRGAEHLAALGPGPATGYRAPSLVRIGGHDRTSIVEHTFYSIIANTALEIKRQSFTRVNTSTPLAPGGYVVMCAQG